MSEVKFSLCALGACEHKKFVEAMKTVLVVMNEYITETTLPCKLNKEIKDIFPATAHFSYTTSIIEENTIKSTMNGLDCVLLRYGICTVKDLEINLIK